jgi:hypothetical protein
MSLTRHLCPTHQIIQPPRPHRKEHPRLESLAVILVVLWLLVLVTSTTMGGLIHVLLVIAVVAIALRFISGRAA